MAKRAVSECPLPNTQCAYPGCVKSGDCVEDRAGMKVRTHATAGHQKWEVITVCTGFNNFDVDTCAARMGEEGWEPWAITLMNGGYDIHFKRKKIQVVSAPQK